MLVSILLIYTENGHQYDSKQKKVLNLIRESTTDIVIPASVEEIKAGSTSTSAFSLCASKIQTVSFEADSKLTTFGSSLLQGTSVQVIDFSNCPKLLTIYDACCSDCKQLREFKFPPNAEVVGAGAFQSSSIQEIYFPDSLKKITTYNTKYGCAFGYSSINTIHIGKGSQITEIGTHAFYSCKNLHEIFLPKSLKTLGNAVFCLCPITKFEIDAENGFYSTDGVTIYNKDGTQILSVSTNDFNKNYTVNSKVMKIKNQAFRNVPSKTIIFTNQSVELEASAFYDSYIEELVYPTGLTEVTGSLASSSSRLARVVLHDGVKVIYQSAFLSCPKLTEIVMSKSLEIIETNAFASCTGLRTIFIPNSVTTIQQGAFSSCSNQLEFDFENKTRFIFNTGVLYCDGIFVDYIRDSDNNNIVIPKSVKLISNHMFKWKKLHSLSFEEPATATYIGIESFAYSSINEVTFGSSINTLSDRCFSSCTNLETVNFDGPIKIIPPSAFYGCTKLRTFSFKEGNQVETISERAFMECGNIQVFSFEMLSNLKTIKEYAFHKTNIPPFTLPASITKIESNAFKETLIESITFNAGCTIENVSSYCFFGSANLKSCVLCSSIKLIDIYAFAQCPKLTSFSLGTGVEIINPFAFSGCTEFSKVIIPAGSKLKHIMGHAFKGTSLSSFEVQGSEFLFKEGLLLDGAATKLIYFIPAENIKMVILPGSIESIGDYAFQHATNLREVFIPEGKFNKVGYCSFEGCTNLKRLTLPSSLRTIEDSAFNGCTNLVCGGLFVQNNMLERVKETGIKGAATTEHCVNNYNALFVQKTCQIHNPIRNNISPFFTILLLLNL